MSVTTLTVWVQDADDQNPRFLAERYKAILPERHLPVSLLFLNHIIIKVYITQLIKLTNIII